MQHVSTMKYNVLALGLAAYLEPDRGVTCQLRLLLFFARASTAEQIREKTSLLGTVEAGCCQRSSLCAQAKQR